MKTFYIICLMIATGMTASLITRMICEKPPIFKIVPARTNGIYRVTAYCPCSKCCGKWSDGMTASGAPAKGKLIAAPKDIPFGTWLNVPGYGWAEVKDRGGSIKGKRLDVFFESHQEAMNWGVQYLEIRQ
jgi:3D (Asp-Asp-Asp) domain-containing protein